MKWLPTLVLVLAVTVSAQELDLPRPIAPPTLQGPTYAETLIANLQTEIQELARTERGVGERERTILRASINVRIIAADLLTEGEVAGASGSMSTLAGIRLALGREAIDEAIGALKNPASIAPLDAFNADAVDLAPSIRTTDTAALDTALPQILAGLIRAVEPSLEVPPTSHWPLSFGGGSPPGRDAAAPSIQALRVLLDTSGLRDDTAALAEAIIDTLEDGSDAADLRHRIDAARRHVRGVLEFAEALAAADWLDAMTIAAYAAELHAAVALFEEVSTRAGAVLRLERLERTRRLLVGLTPLRGSVDLRVIGQTLAALDAVSSRSTSDERGLQILGLVVDRMTRYRALKPVALPRDIKPVRAKLDRAYEAAEKALVSELPALADGIHVHADPAFTTLIADQAHYLADVERLARVPEWLAAIDRVHPPAVMPFRRRLKRVGLSLLDPNRRDDAIVAIRRLEREITNLASLPYEAELAARSRAAIIATGGLDKELLAVIASTRRAWVKELVRGSGDEWPAARMRLLHRLTSAMADAEDLLLLDESDLMLDRWAAWEMPRSLIQRGATELPNRLKLATAGIVNGRDAAAAQQLDRIDREAPVTKLVGRLSARLASALAPLPDGVAAVLGQLVYPPSSDAWMLAHRADIAQLCRYAVEADHAARHERAEEADALHDFMNDRASALLEALGTP